MDTAAAKKFNVTAGFQSDTAIAFFDALSANCIATDLMKIPKVPNTKGKYLAQYLDVSGTADIHGYNGNKDYFVIYRVLPTGIVKYFIEADTIDFKNNNSRNHYLVGDLGKIYGTILDYRKHLIPCKNMLVKVLIFTSNLNALCERKKDTTLLLRKVASAITGKTVEEFIPNRYHGIAMIADGCNKLNKLRGWISEMERYGLIKFKK